MLVSDLVVGNSYWVIHPNPNIPTKKEQMTYIGTGTDNREGHKGQTTLKFKRDTGSEYSCLDCQVIFVHNTESEADDALATAQEFLDSHTLCTERVCPYGLTDSCAKFTEKQD